ncbi:HAD family hydrolase, partial [Planctomycetaceae bacterium AH-315-I19]|nr:HAD family hydrolase [Planctomycetaceae bacterium AH-315-I19]
MPTPAIFFDRDDTLIECNGITPAGDLGDPALVRLLPGALEAVRDLRNAGYAIVVFTNQGGVARGSHTIADVSAVNDRLNELLGGTVDAFRFCPWHPEGTVAPWSREHHWRKPAPGMILDAAHSLGLDLERSWVIGDAERDCHAGREAGCRTILIGASLA